MFYVTIPHTSTVLLPTKYSVRTVTGLRCKTLKSTVLLSLVKNTVLDGKTNFINSLKFLY